ncbi:uncharacterized protein LOC130112794 [Lampris incognitus]|uniref:uncharacterized protein LOC130112794 n=1 Tax=Lampris incognitus TaxID=2546036 RepID=UPI0024B595B7|nr:uncharacterized protein LOC130112794 [Lampris incognitus]
MNSRRPELSHRRQYGDRNTRQWSDNDNRWIERGGHPNDMPRYSYHDYGEGHGRTERTRGTREYSDSPERKYSKKSLHMEENQRSPVRRQSLSSLNTEKDFDWDRKYVKLREDKPMLSWRKRGHQVTEDHVVQENTGPNVKQFSEESKTFSEPWTSEKKQWSFLKDEGDELTYKQHPQGFMSGQSPNDHDYRHSLKDSKHRESAHEDFKYRKNSEDSPYRQPSEEFAYRRSSKYHLDRHFQDGNSHPSEERTQEKEFSSRVHTKPRDRHDRPSSPPYEIHCQTRTRSPVKSRRQVVEAESDVTSQDPALTGRAGPRNTAAKGFQRFLSILNKGVDVDMLTKIVSRDPVVADDLDTSWSRSSARHPKGHCVGFHRSENLGSQSDASLRNDPSHPASEGQRIEHHSQNRSPGDFQRCSLSNEISLQRSDDIGRGHFSSSSRSRSPPLVLEKKQIRPEDEQKCRQMRDVLHAIGMDLGLDELGQMSSRIQERLYGKKECNESREIKGEREETRNTLSPGRHSRSLSSSRSSFAPLTQHLSMRRDSLDTPRDTVEVPQTIQSYVGVNSNVNENKSQKSIEALHTSFSINPTTYMSAPPPAPQIQTYPLKQYSPYSCSPPAFSPSWGIGGGSLPIPPHVPRHIPYPTVPLSNIHRPAFGPSPILPQCNSIRQLNLSLTSQSPFPVLPGNTTTNSKTLSRPRCLHVIDTQKPKQEEAVTEVKTK